MTTNSNQRPVSLDEWMNEEINKCIRGKHSKIDALAIEESALVGRMLFARKYRNDGDFMNAAREFIARIEVKLRDDRQEILLEQT